MTTSFAEKTLDHSKKSSFTISQKTSIWIRTLRAPFFTASIIPLTVGIALAWYINQSVDLFTAFLTIICGILIHAGTNLANDYYDQDADTENQFFSPFNGGSRTIQGELVSPKQVKIAFILSFIVGILLTGYLLFITEAYLVVVFLLVAITLGFFYTASPLQFSYNGLGEIAVFMGFGPLGVFAGYYIQTLSINIVLLSFISLPIALLIATVLLINELPDFEADKAAGKRTLTVVLGKYKVSMIIHITLICSYLSIIVGILLNYIPIISLLTFLTIPIATKMLTNLRKNYADPKTILPSNGQMIMIHLSFGILLIISLAIPII